MDADTFALLRETVRRLVDERLIPNEDRFEHEDALQALLRDAGLRL